MRIKAVLTVAIVAGCVGCSALRSARPAVVVEGGNAERGKAAIGRRGCGSCHTIQGIYAARGLVGPPLTGIGARAYVGGVLPNTPQNLIRWIRDPHAIDAQTAMPTLGVGSEEAADIASYLYSTK